LPAETQFSGRIQDDRKDRETDSADFRTAKKAITAAIRSIDEWIASDMMLTEPIANPTIYFIRTSPLLEMTDWSAVFSIFSRPIKIPS
jgi:hypothetical protein